MKAELFFSCSQKSNQGDCKNLKKTYKLLLFVFMGIYECCYFKLWNFGVVVLVYLCMLYQFYYLIRLQYLPKLKLLCSKISRIILFDLSFLVEMDYLFFVSLLNFLFYYYRKKNCNCTHWHWRYINVQQNFVQKCKFFARDWVAYSNSSNI